MPLFRALATHGNGPDRAMPFYLLVEQHDIVLNALGAYFLMAPLPAGHPVGLSDQVLVYQYEVRDAPSDPRG